jgi:hypothetical protein
MQRRAFLKRSAVGIGALAGFYGGIFNAEEMLGEQGPDEKASASGSGAWGINAAVLGTAWNKAPSPNEILGDTEHTLSLSRFLRVGGENQAATPTDCYVGYSRDALFVLFRCKEKNMQFPYANLDPKDWRETDWYWLPGLPSGSGTNWPFCSDTAGFEIWVQPVGHLHSRGIRG